MARLKPCPFCGGEARTYTYNYSDKGKVRIASTLKLLVATESASEDIWEL